MDFIKIILFSLLIVSDLNAIKFIDEYCAANNFFKKNYDLSQKNFEKILINDPGDFNALYNLANIFYEKKEFEKANNYYKKLADTNLTNEKKEQIHFNYACSLFQTNNLKDSLANFEKVLEINPENIRAKENAQKIRKLLEQKEKQDKSKEDKQKKEKEKKDSEKDSNQKNDQQQNDESKKNENNDSNSENNNSSEKQKNEEHQKESKKNNNQQEDSKNDDNKNDKQDYKNENNESQQKNNENMQENNNLQEQKYKKIEEENKKKLGKKVSAFLEDLQEQEKELNKYFIASKMKNNNAAQNGQKNW